MKEIHLILKMIHINMEKQIYIQQIQIDHIQ